MPDPTPRFEQAYETHHAEIMNYLWRLCSTSGRTAEAADLCQETFIKAYRAYDTLRPGSNVRAWLYRIATHTAYSAFRKKSSQAHTALDDVEYRLFGGGSGPEGSLIARQQVDGLLAELTALPDKQQAAVVMRYLQDMSYDEIAEALGCSRDSARANVSHGVRRLRLLMEEV